jgi:ADP-ribosylglycohydrolase
LLYGFDSIPNEWLNQLARKEDIEDLAKRMSEALS